MHTQGTPNRLRELRERRGARLIEVAAAAQKDQTMIPRYEKGEIPIPDDVKARLAVFYGVSRAYLMGWDEPAEKAA